MGREPYVGPPVHPGHAGSQGSGVLRSMSDANCYYVLDEAQGSIAVGDPVDIEVFEGVAS